MYSSVGEQISAFESKAYLRNAKELIVGCYVTDHDVP